MGACLQMSQAGGQYSGLYEKWKGTSENRKIDARAAVVARAFAEPPPPRKDSNHHDLDHHHFVLHSHDNNKMRERESAAKPAIARKKRRLGVGGHPIYIIKYKNIDILILWMISPPFKKNNMTDIIRPFSKTARTLHCA